MNKIDLNTLIRLFRIKASKRVDKKFLTYGIFVGIAAVFWLLNELDEDYNTTINYPVKYVNLPEDKFLVNELPPSLKLTVEAYGYTLMRYKLSPSPSPIAIDLTEFSKRISTSNEKFILHTRYIKDMVNREIPNNIVVSEILPDTLVFQFTDKISKKVPIIPIARYTLADQCLLRSGIILKPDSIEIRGPRTIIDTLKGIKTRVVRFKKLNTVESKNAHLEELEHISYSKQKIVMEMPVSKYTQTKTKVPVQAINVPDSFVLRTFPKEVTLSYLVPLDHYDQVDADAFRLEVNYHDIENLLGQKLPVSIQYNPPSVKKISMHPADVEFVLEKRNE